MYKILFLMISILICQTDKFEEGVAYYNGRAEGANGLVPNADNISKAIKVFESLQEPYDTSESDTSESDLKASIYLVKSYYFNTN